MSISKPYSRDGRAPIPVKESTSVVMRANKAKNTKPELMLRNALWSNGFRGYRLHWGKVPGKPDIAFTVKMLAVFVNGCFWHRCPYCKLPYPKSNLNFWKEKFDKNIARDKKKMQELEREGWKVLVLWECEIKSDVTSCVDNINSLLAK